MPDGSQPEHERHQLRQQKRQEQQAERDAEETAEEAARVARARAIWSERQPLAGTVAEKYLTETRRIPRPASGWPDCIGFHPSRHALIVAVMDDAGAMQAVQVIHLTSDARKRPDEPNRPTKQSFGVISGAALKLPRVSAPEGENTAPLLLAEGPETGLSIWAATGRETWVALGSMAKVTPPPGRALLICADDDPPHAPATKSLHHSLGDWRAAGHKVVVAYPWPVRRHDKSDFNDVIRQAGAEAVRERIATAWTTAPARRPRLPIEEARARLVAAVEEFFRQAADFDDEAEDVPAPIVHAIKVDVGIGKSARARDAAAKLLAEMRAKGDGRLIALFVPTHKLADEQAAAFNAQPHGFRAAVWRGREQPDPDNPLGSMCMDLEAVRDAQSVALPVESSVCRKRGENGGICPFFEVCAYQRQKQQDPDLWIFPHELLFVEKPAAIGKVAVAIVDEAIWQTGLTGVDGKPDDLTLEALAGDVSIPNDLPGIDTAELVEAHRALLGAIHGLPDGPLPRKHMAERMLAETARSGHSLSWRRVIDPGLRPGMPKATRKELVRLAQNNKLAMRTAKMFNAVAELLAPDGPEASGWVSLATVEKDEGPVRVLRLRGRQTVKKGWIVPTLLLDAYLNPDLVRPYWPQAEVTAELEAETPNMEAHQLVGRDFGKTALVPDAYCNDTGARGRLWASAEVRATVLREARNVTGKTLVVAQEAVEEQWRNATSPWPASVDLAHHNAVAGRDEWGPGPDRPGVAQIIVVGRTLPREGDVERMAEALTGRALTHRGVRYERHDTPVYLASGEIVSGLAFRHPDPTAEAIRWQICEGEVLQIIGRGRGVNRTADNPLRVLVLTNIPLPLPINSQVSWESLAPSPADRMLSEGGMALANPGDAAQAYPALWPSRDAAKKAFSRGGWGQSRIGNYLYGNVPNLGRVVYQRAGAGRSVSDGVYDPEAVADPRAWLVERLGELAHLEIHPPPAAQQDPQRPAEAPEGSTSPAEADHPPQRPGNPAMRPCSEGETEAGVSAQYAREVEADLPPVPATAISEAPEPPLLHPPLPGEMGQAPPPPRTGRGMLGVIASPPPDPWPEPGSWEPPELPEDAEAPPHWRAELKRRLAEKPRPKVWNDFTDVLRQTTWQREQDRIRAEWVGEWRAAVEAEMAAAERLGLPEEGEA
ncbi:DUF7146 domain-containing protein [Siccirubricoccus phaeus]|uniref:DUF7146 domain-containing protein n=1 Tax=Siccirubricoccus phaeus TaxID=2595053 RepID=UPI001A9C3B80|nr:toprim domain-containing protein [Siccirubricoccus phaeus]